MLYSQALLVLFLVMGASYIRGSTVVNPGGYSLAFGFSVFWAASYLALSGHAQDAYEIARLSGVVQVIVPTLQGFYGWFYPPAFYLLVLPFSLLPYLSAYLVFMMSTLLGYVVVVRHIIKGKEVMWCLAAFPGVWVEFFTGQNGFLTAALAGAALLALERRPWLAGALIGMLVIKPHLALLFPVALIAIGAWRTIFAAAVVAVALTFISTAILGTGTFEAWLYSIRIARASLENGAFPLSKMPTVFALLRLWGASVMVAYAGQALSAAIALISVWRVWRQTVSWPLRNAALMTAALLTSPYLYYYDLAWLALPIAWLTTVGLKEGWLRGEREVLLVVWLLPLVMLAGLLAGQLMWVQMGPLVLLALLWIILRRVRTSTRHGTGAPQNNP